TSGGSFNGTHVVWNVGALNVGSNVTLTLVVRINGTGNITNNANVSADQPNIGNNSTGNNSTNFTVNSTVNLSIVKTHNATGVNVGVGDLVEYTIVVTNFGPDNATSVVIVDALDPRLVYISSTGGGSFNGTHVVWNVGLIPMGTNVTLTLVVRVNGTGDIINTANLTVNETNIGNNSTGNNSTNFTVDPTVNLTITKTNNLTSGAVVNVGDLIEYTIVVTNFGPDNATGVVVSDALDPRLVYISSTGGGSFNGTHVVWNVGGVNVGTNVTLTLVVTVNGTGNIPNIANVTVNETNIGNNSTDGNESNFTVNSTVNLTITKTSNATEFMNVGDLVEYTIFVSNSGPDNATGVIVTDVLDPRLVFVSATSGGSFNGTHVVWNVGALNVGSNVTLTLVVRINGTGNITNNASVTADQPNIGNNSTGNNSTNFTVNSTVNLSIVKTHNATGVNVGVGDLVEYTIVVTNFGPDNATSVVIVDALDPRLIYISSTGGGIFNGTHVVWNVGLIPMGTNVTLSLVVRVNGTGNIPNTANLTVNETNIGNNSTGNNSTNLTVNSTVNLTITKTSNATEFMNVGDLVEYTIVVSNSGPDNATGVVVTDILDPRLVFVSATGNYSLNGTHIRWNVGNLNVGNNVTLTLVVRINGTGSITNNASVSADQPNIGNNSTGNNSTNFTVNATVNLSITKVNNLTSGAVVSVGDLVTYTITVTNFGPDVATNVVVTDVLDYRLIFVSATGYYNATSGEWLLGNLNVGSSLSMNITVRVNGTGNIANIANVTADQPNIGNNTTDGNDTNFTVGPTVNLTITKTSNATASMNVGDLVEYTIVVRNFGPDNATGVIVTDILDPRLVLISATGSYTFNGTHIIWNVSNLNVGDNVTLTLVVRINGTGNITNNASVTADQPNIGNNSTDGNGTNFTVDALVNLTITKTHNVTTTVVVGDNVSYTITVANSGPDNATGVLVIDILDSRLTYLNYSASVGTYNPVNGQWNIGSLAVGQNATLTIFVMVNSAGNISNLANVTVHQDNAGDTNASSPPLIADYMSTFIEVENITQNTTIPFTINGNVTSANGWIVNGFVNITIDGTVYSVQVVNGRFNLSLTYNVSGNYSFTVEYFGNESLAASNASGWVYILPIATTTTVNTTHSLIFDYPTNITGRLLDFLGRPIAGATITFVVNGIVIGTNTTNAQGIAIYSFIPDTSTSTYVIEAIYGGNTTYLGSNDSISLIAGDMRTRIIIDDVTTKPFRNTSIPITLINEFGSPMPGQIISVVIDGIEYNLTTDANGRVFVYHTPLDATPVLITAEFIGNASHQRSDEIGVLNVVRLSTEIRLNDLNLNPTQTASFSATLVDEDGRLLTNMDVDVYIGDVFIGTFTTDANGQIHVNGASVPQGASTITAVFSGYANIWENSISVSALTVRLIRTSLTVSVNQTPNETTTFVARLYDEFNRPLANKNIVFFLDGVFIGMATTDGYGIATFEHPYVDRGRIVAEFLGDDIHRESLDNRLFGISAEPVNDTDLEEEEDDDDLDFSEVLGDDEDYNDSDDVESVENNNRNSNPLIAMAAAGNPLAMILLCILSMLLVGFRYRKKN
ncbi:MAG: hypothetical protein FWH29_01905, partial [Methanobrevibacter sp.]|nr:hypothetical protein [Methanobrevibacter sp.]